MQACTELPRSSRSTASRRKVAIERLAAAEAPEESRRIDGLPPLGADLRLRAHALVRRLRLCFELSHVSTASLEALAAQPDPWSSAGNTAGHFPLMRADAREEQQ